MTSEELKQENYQKIIHVTKQLLLENGSKSTTFVIIAKEAGVAKRTVINIFETKTNLILLTMISLIDDFYQKVEQLIESDQYLNSTGLEQIMQLLILRAKHYYDNPNLAKLIIEVEGLEVKTELEQKNCVAYLRKIDYIENYFIDPLTKGRVDGSIKKNLNEKAALQMLFFSFGVIVQRLSQINLNKTMSKYIDVKEAMRSTLNITKEFLAN